MKASLIILLAGVLIGISCSGPPTRPTPVGVPAPPVMVPLLEDVGTVAKTPEVRVAADPRPELPRHPLKVRKNSYNGIDLTAVTFDRRDYSLRVVDQKGGPGSQYDDAEEAAEGAPAAINGGFFGPDGEPVGLVITGGERRGYFNSSSYLGTGILDGEAVTLSTRKSKRRSSELLQSGPRLVWQGETLTGLSSNNPRPRSFLIWDGAEHFGLAYANSASLKGLSTALENQAIPGFPIRYALNLDGGTSCDLWVSGSVPGGGFSKSSFFRKKARNYLVLSHR